ncbi:MAG: hypothetical protein HZB25_01945 [Candidatus Eisenbacteria bacterium]|nr:hypothetical protein [Candidatus Eisenbacteria bacterium]
MIRCRPGIRQLTVVLLTCLVSEGHAAPLLAAAWTPLSPPKPCQGGNCYDSMRDRMLLYDGSDNGAWALPFTLPTGWQRIAPAGQSPPPRTGAAVIYDAGNDRIVIFGGYAAGLLNDAWALTLSGPGSPAWTRLEPDGTPPAARQYASAMCDAAGGRMVVFGGSGAHGLLNDTWVLTLPASGTPTWTQLAPAGVPPAPRYSPATASDGTSLFLHGGGDAVYTDTWKLSLGASPAWTQIFPSGTPPAEIYVQAMVYDPSDTSLIYFAGTNRRLSLNGSPEWHALEFSGTGGGTFNFDPVLSPLTRTVWAAAGLTISPCNSAGTCIGNVSRLDLATGHYSNPIPDARSGHAAVFDGRRDRMLLFGGAGMFSEDSAGVYWAYSPGTATWSRHRAAGGPPSFHGCFMDGAGDRVLVVSRDVLWSLPLSGTGDGVWSAQATMGAEAGTAAGFFNAAFDPAGRRVLAFSGEVGNTDTWALGLSDPPAWSLINPADSVPQARWAASTIFDLRRNRLVVFGGRYSTYGGWGSSSELNDAWGLDPATGRWTRLANNLEPRPLAREGAAAVYDSLGDRMVVFGGFNNITQFGIYLGDVWALNLGAASWQKLEAGYSGPTQGRGSTMALDGQRRRAIIFGGTDDYCVAQNELWGLDLALEIPIDVEAVRRIAPGGLEPPGPNPSFGISSIAFTLARPGRARLLVLDVSGAIVRVLHDGPSPSGRSGVEWDGRDGNGRVTPSGAYFLRLESGEGVSSRRLMRIR